MARCLRLSRIARVIAPDLPHHVTQRGSLPARSHSLRGGDQDTHGDPLTEQTQKCSVEVLAYCLMPNPVHLILVPGDTTGLARVVGATRSLPRIRGASSIPFP